MKRKRNGGSELRLIAHGVRSAHNVGALFRTADGAGVSRLYLVGTTPAPTDRFGRARADIAKVALGAEKCVPWETARRFSPLSRRLKREGFLVIALEQTDDAFDCSQYVPAGKKV